MGGLEAGLGAAAKLFEERHRDSERMFHKPSIERPFGGWVTSAAAR
jgi:hypothetical protein